MGSAWSGSPGRQVGNTQNFNPQVQSSFDQFAKGGPGGITNMNYDIMQNPLFQEAGKATNSFLQPFDPQQFEQLFQKGVADPAMRNYEQQVLPGIANRYMDQSNFYGSGLNQALSQSSQDLGNQLGELRARGQGQAYENHQNRQFNSIAQALGLSQAPLQQEGQRFNEAMSYFNQLFGTHDQTPITQGPQSGWMKDITQLIAQLGGAFLGGGGNIGFGGGPQSNAGNIGQVTNPQNVNWDNFRSQIGRY